MFRGCPAGSSRYHKTVKPYPHNLILNPEVWFYLLGVSYGFLETATRKNLVAVFKKTYIEKPYIAKQHTIIRNKTDYKWFSRIIYKKSIIFLNYTASIVLKIAIQYVWGYCKNLLSGKRKYTKVNPGLPNICSTILVMNIFFELVFRIYSYTSTSKIWDFIGYKSLLPY